jgi:hypothetical protein
MMGRMRCPRRGTIVLSALLVVAGWAWLRERARRLERSSAPASAPSTRWITRVMEVGDLIRPETPWDEGIIFDGPADPGSARGRNQQRLRDLILDITLREEQLRDWKRQPAIHFYDDRLILSGPPRLHEAVAELLRAIRSPESAVIPTRQWVPQVPVLDVKVPDRTFDEVPLDEALRELAGSVRAYVDCEWEALNRYHVDSEARLTLAVRGMTLREAIEAAMTATHPHVRVALWDDGDGLVLTSPDPDDRKRVHSIRTYDVADLLAAGDDSETGPAALVALIKEAVARETWIDNGGREGSLRLLGKTLIVTQLNENHNAINELLGKLREPRPSAGATSRPASRPAR